MVNVKEQLKLYRKRICQIKNKKLEIENLEIKGLKDKKILIKELKMQINELENENKKIDNILALLDENEYKVIDIIYLQGKDKKKASKQLDRTERQINYSLNKALKHIEKDWII